MDTIKIAIYTTASGKAPYSDWQNKLDLSVRAIVRTRVDRMRLGNFGDCKLIKGGGGLRELRISHGAGYRIYFGITEKVVVMFLAGGNKGSQERDIIKAKQYWLDCKELVNE